MHIKAGPYRTVSAVDLVQVQTGGADAFTIGLYSRAYVLAFILHCRPFSPLQTCSSAKTFVALLVPQEALDRGAFESATAVWGAQQAAVANVTDNVDWCTPACAELTDDNNSPACHNAAFRDEHLVAQYLALRHRYNALLHDPEDSASAAASRWLSNSHIAGRQALQAPSLC